MADKYRRRGTRNLPYELLNNDEYRQLKREFDSARDRLMNSEQLNGATVQILKRNVSRLMKEMEKLKEKVRNGG